MGDGGMVGLHGDAPALDPRADPRGRRIAGVLVGAWRHSPPPLEMSEPALDEITLGLLRSKTGALAWWRVRNSSLRTSPAGARLRDAYQNHGLQTAMHAGNLARVVTRLRNAGVEPVLVKGPSIGRLYAERGLRPFADLDLCVRPDQHDAAAAALSDWVREFSAVDLHRGFRELEGQSWDELYERSQLVRFGAVDVRVLAAEDHLRLLCLHLLRHGAQMPLWLCDVAASVESRPPRFDWDLVLGAEPRRADWVACTIGLAHRLLGSAIDDTPVADRAARLPAWLIPSVLESWGRQCAADYQNPELSPDTWDLLKRAPDTLRMYWPSPVAASVHLRQPFSNFPRLPIQVVDAIARLARFSLRRLRGQRPEFDH
jgi:hypothetical protein